MRAAWTAEEILYEFGDRIQRLSLVPSASGRFEVTADGRLIFSKAGEGRFPELREIKDKLRELV